MGIFFAKTKPCPLTADVRQPMTQRCELRSVMLRVVFPGALVLSRRRFGGKKV
jgi:hypothetical protein